MRYKPGKIKLNGKLYIVMGPRRTCKESKLKYTCDAFLVPKSGVQREVRNAETLDALARLRLFSQLEHTATT